MSLIDTYKQKLEAQIQEQKAQLDLLKARARRIAVQGKFAGKEELAQADKHLAHIKAKLNELRGAGGGALAEIRSGVKNALADLKISTRKAAHHFDAHLPTRLKSVRITPRARAKRPKPSVPVPPTKPAPRPQRSKPAKKQGR